MSQIGCFIMNRNMFYFSEVQYKSILSSMWNFELKDATLVSCQQMIETLLKGLLIERDGTCNRTYSLKNLYRSYTTDNYKKYKSILSDLTDCYFDCRYAGDGYIDYSKDEVKSMVTESLQLRDYLLSLRKSDLPDSKNF